MALRKSSTGIVAGAALVTALGACGPLGWAAGHGGPSKPAAKPTAPVTTTTPPRAHHPRPTSGPTASPTAAPSTTAPPTTAPPTTAPPTTAPPTTAPSTTAPASTTDAYEARILVLVNQQRASAGLSPLVASTCADGFAESWAPVLQANGALSHQSLSPILTSCHSRTAGENVAYGNVTADQMMTMWMNSAGHRANILSPNYTAIGIAAVTDSSGRWYGVQDFTG